MIEGFDALVPEVDDVLQLLELHGVLYVDKHSTGGTLWMIGGEALGKSLKRSKHLA